jgi:outer membrane biosynthesis protein TonB
MKKIIAMFTTVCLFALAVMSIDGLSSSPIEDETTTQVPVSQSAEMVNMTEADVTTTEEPTTQIITTEVQTTAEMETTVEETTTKKARKKKPKKKKVEETTIETTKAPVNYNKSSGSGSERSYVPSTRKSTTQKQTRGKEEIKKWDSGKGNERLE